MQTKLTLRLEEGLIRKAKRSSRKSGKNVVNVIVTRNTADFKHSRISIRLPGNLK